MIFYGLAVAMILHSSFIFSMGPQNPQQAIDLHALDPAVYRAAVVLQALSQPAGLLWQRQAQATGPYTVVSSVAPMICLPMMDQASNAGSLSPVLVYAESDAQRDKAKKFKRKPKKPNKMLDHGENEKGDSSKVCPHCHTTFNTLQGKNAHIRRDHKSLRRLNSNGTKEQAELFECHKCDDRFSDSYTRTCHEMDEHKYYHKRSINSGDTFNSSSKRRF